MVRHAAHVDTRFFSDFAPHSVLDGLAGLHEASERRVKAGRVARAAAEEAGGAVAVEDERDDDGVGAGVRDALDVRGGAAGEGVALALVSALGTR